jgi:hypothetical protein
MQAARKEQRITRLSALSAIRDSGVRSLCRECCGSLCSTTACIDSHLKLASLTDANAVHYRTGSGRHRLILSA